jgi:peptide/nickel transport system substrate-binding protein
MKAADVVRSLKLCAESSNTATYGTAANCEAVDDYTVKIHTDEPYSGLLYDLAHHGNDILPADLIDGGHNFNESPIGTGPYKFVKWNLGESLEFEANPDYFEGEPAIKHMIWRIIPEGSSRTIALEAGEIDVIIEVEANDISRLQEDDGIDVFVGTGTSHNFMLVNTEKAPFNNEEFRIACQQAIDKNACVQVGQNGFAQPCDSLLPIVFPGTTTDGMPTYNVEEAKKHLEASGLTGADANFTLVCSDDAKERLGQVIQANLKENLGIEVTIERQDLATYLETSRIGDYQAALGGYTSSSLLAYIKGVWHSSNINASNKTRTNDPHVDELIEKYAASFDAKEQEGIATELNTYLNQHCFQIPTYQGQVTRAYVSNLKGFQVSPSGNHWWQYCYFD